MFKKSKRLSQPGEKKNQQTAPDEMQDSVVVKDKSHDKVKSEAEKREDDKQEKDVPDDVKKPEDQKTPDDVPPDDPDEDERKKREKRRIEVEQELQAYEEKQKEKSRQKELKAQMNKIRDASMMQIALMRERAKQYQKDLNHAVQNHQDTAGLAQAYIRDQNKILYGGNGLSEQISMSINDAMLNSSRDKDGNTPATLKDMIFGRDNVGKQRTIVINGRPVTLDDDVALAVEKRRDPIGSSMKLEKTKESKRLSSLSVSEEKNVSANVQENVEKTAEVVDKEAEKTSKNAEKESRQAVRKEKYYQAQFDDLSRQLEYDSRQGQYLIDDAYPAARRTQYAYDDGYTYENQRERNADKRKQRALPAAALTWGIMYDHEMLAHGRELPSVNDEMVIQRHEYQKEDDMQY